MPSVQSFLSVATLASHAAAQDGNKATCSDQSGMTVAEEVSVVQTKIPAVASTGTPEVFGSFTAVYDGVDKTAAGAVAEKAVEMNINLDVSAITTWLDDLQKDLETDDVGSNPLAGIEVGDFLVGSQGAETCNTTEFSWHIHTMWDNLEKNWAYGTDCGPDNTGPHYDPTEKCGPAAECEEVSADYDTTCGTTTEDLKGGCELGDLSGRHGNLDATTTPASDGVLATTTISRGSKPSSEAIMDSFFPASAGFGPIFGVSGAETDDSNSKPRSLVLHLTCTGTPRVFCAKLFSTIGVKNTNKDFADDKGNFPAAGSADTDVDVDAGNV